MFFLLFHSPEGNTVEAFDQKVTVHSLLDSTESWKLRTEQIQSIKVLSLGLNQTREVQLNSFAALNVRLVTSAVYSYIVLKKLDEYTAIPNREVQRFIGKFQ